MCNVGGRGSSLNVFTFDLFSPVSIRLYRKFRLSHRHNNSRWRYPHLVVHAAFACALSPTSGYSKSIRGNFLLAVYGLYSQVPTHFRHEFGVEHDFIGFSFFIRVEDRLKDSFSISEIIIVGADVNSEEFSALNESVDSHGQILFIQRDIFGIVNAQ